MVESYLYHRVPENMQGTILYPLNELKNIYPNSYVERVKKYEGREHVLEARIPAPLNCLWNDALHFTAVPPSVLFNNLESAGFNASELVWKEWFKVSVDLLDPANTIVCLYRRDIALVPKARDFHPFESDKIDEYAIVPPETLEYYREKFAKEERPLFFHRVPHILYKGTIDTKNLSVVSV